MWNKNLVHDTRSLAQVPISILLIVLLFNCSHLRRDRGSRVVFTDPVIEKLIKAQLKKKNVYEPDLAKIKTFPKINAEVNEEEQTTFFNPESKERISAPRIILLGANLYPRNIKNYSKMEIRQIDDFKLMPNLEYVDLGNHPIKNITSIKYLYKLKFLKLSGKDIEDYTPLSGLDSLKYFIMYGSNIGSLTVFKGLTKLKSLAIPYAKINSLAGIEKLENLMLLDIMGNQIEDLSPLLNNKGLGYGNRVYALENPLNEKSINEIISELKKRGVHVVY